MMWLEPGLEWIKGIGLLQESLEMVDHHSLQQLASKGYIGKWTIVVSNISRQIGFFLDRPSECLIEGEGNPALKEKPINNSLLPLSR